MALVPASASELPLPRPLAPGSRLTLLKLIARGGMGEVFLAASGGIEGAERPCVVKVIRREHVKDPSFLARFLDEARVQTQLSHPGVAQVLEASMDGADEPYVVVEYVEGRSLAELRARAIQLGVKVGWSEGVAMAASMAEALAHVHERADSRGQALGIAHRDLSPQNVMIAFGGDTKLIDFGTARGANRKSRTVAGVVYAKPGYVAPEVANGIPGDALVDVYALGIMLWEVCAGRRFLAGDPAEHMAAVGANQRNPPALGGDVPPELDRVIAKMTAFAKEDRATARAAFADLVKMLSGAPGLANGERGVRARIASLLTTLYPSEPKRSRAEFQKLVSDAKKTLAVPAKVDAATPTVAAKTPSDLLPGTRYRVVRTLGEGASGVVYEAVQVDLSRRVALKVLAPERSARVEDAARFRREACALSNLTHEGLVRLYDFGVASDGRLFFAMDYLEGETLERLLSREKALPISDALRIAKSVASALEAAHAVALVHRDIKPGNVMITHSGGVKVLDFGVACGVSEGPEKDASNSGLALFGTPEYMAPEQIDGSAIDGRADVYALGAMLYEMLTGRLPFAGQGVAMLELKRKGPPEAPSERAPAKGIPAAVDALVMRALAIKPENRFATAAEFRVAMEAAECVPAGGRKIRRGLGVAAVSLVMAGALALLGLGVTHRYPATGVAARNAATKVASFVRPKAAPPPTAAPEPALAEAKAIPAAPPPAIAEIPKASHAKIETPSDFRPEEPHLVGLDDDKVGPDDEEPKVVAAKEDPKSARAKAKRAASKKRWRLARKYAEEWMKTDKGVEPRLVLAKALAYSGRGAEAHEVLSSLLEAHPTCDEAREILHDLDSKTAFKAKRAPGKVAMAKGKRLEGRSNVEPRSAAGSHRPSRSRSWPLHRSRTRLRTSPTTRPRPSPRSRADRARIRVATPASW